MQKKYEKPVILAVAKSASYSTACGKYSACGELVRGR